jgi:Zn-dependent metalloprotease
MRSHRAVAAAASAATLAALLAVPPAAASGPGVAGAPAGLTLVATRHSLLGTHRWYQQTYHGLPVLDGYYAEHTDRSGHVTVDDGRVAVPAGTPVTPDIPKVAAEARAQRGTAALDAPAATDQHSQLAVLGGPGARLVWRVVDTTAAGSTESVVDATSGAVVSRRSLVDHATGRGQVFSPNPVVTLRKESLKDNNDANQAVLDPAYRTVSLTGLDTSGKLRGTYVRITNANLASSATRSFVYKRNDDRFEQVSAYYDISQAQAYLHSLGFTDVNSGAQKVKTDGMAADNSFYDSATDTITYGSGGVDDAEDAEVVWHEYGHAMQDSQVPGFGSSEQAGAIGEGFGDYWAVTMSRPVSNGFDVACVADWDSTAYTSGSKHCLRRVDGKKTTAAVDGEVHDDGEIWSRALWDISAALGRTHADKVIVESQFDYSPATTFAKAANQVVATATSLYGATAAAKVRSAFVARKILR